VREREKRDKERERETERQRQRETEIERKLGKEQRSWAVKHNFSLLIYPSCPPYRHLSALFCFLKFQRLKLETRERGASLRFRNDLVYLSFWSLESRFLPHALVKL
jgi:hypothetical protein